MSPIQTLLNRTWLRSLAGTKRKTVTRQPSRLGKVIEQLEDRVTPTTFFVSLAGDDTLGLGTAASPYRSIQKALNVAEVDAGGSHTIKVAAGTYNTLGFDNGFSIGNSATPAPNLVNLTLDGGWDASFTSQTFGSSVYLPQTNINNSAPSAVTADVIIYESGVTIRGFTFVFDGLQGNGGTKVSGGLQTEAQSIVITQNTIEVGHSTANPRSAGIVIHSPSGGFSTGVQVTNNTIVANGGAVFGFFNGSTGIFINPDTVGRVTPIIISGNNISGPNLGTAIAIDRLSYVTVTGNTIQRTGSSPVSTPLIDLRQATSVTGPYGSSQTGIIITNNTLDGQSGAAGNIGIELSARNLPTQQVTGVTITNNFITNVAFGVSTVQTSVQGSGVNITGNSITNIVAGGKAIRFQGTGTANASGNWYGSLLFSTVNGLIAGTVDFTPYLNKGTDTSIVTGFQGDYSDLTVHAAGGQTGATARIQEGVNTVTTFGTVLVNSGSYTGGILVDKPITVTGVGLPTVTAANLSGQDVGFQIAADEALVQGFSITGTGTEYGVLFSDKNSGPAYTGSAVKNNQFTNLGYAIATADGAIDYIGAIIQDNAIDIPVGGGWGIYLQSGSGHTVWGNTITGDADSHAILVQGTDTITIGGTGVGQGNTITGTGSAVIALDTTNTTFIGNTVTGMSGVSGAVRLEGGVSGFAINQNSITGGLVPAVRIRQNFFPAPNSGITINNNDLTGNTYGIQIGAAALTANLGAQGNNFAGNSLGSINNADGTYAVDAMFSYFGSTVAATVGASVTGSADYTPFLNSGTDISPALGFQGSQASITVHTLGTQLGGSGRVQEGVDTVNASGLVNIATGAYTDGVVTVSKANLTADVPTGATGFSFLLGGSTANFTVTGTGAVNITGNAVDNVIDGNGGNNTILGAAGVDTVVFSGNYADYSFFFTGTGPTQTLTFVDNRPGSPDGTDVLNGVELLQFTDGTRRVNPSTLVLSNNIIAENNPIGALVGIFSSDGYQPLPNLVNYSLVSGIGDTGNSKFTISGNQLLANAKFNYEVTPSFSVRVRAEDVGGLFIESVYTINVLDIEEIPPILALARGSTVEWLNGSGAIVFTTPSIPAIFGKAFNIAAIPDRNGDNFPDLIVGSSAIVSGVPVASQVGIVSGKTGALLWNTSPYGTFNGGVNVAAGDVTGDGKLDIITAPMAGGGPHVKAFDGVSYALVRSFMSYAGNFTGGVNVASGDVNGDGRADIVTAPGKGGGPDVRIFNGTSAPTIINGISVAPTMLNNFNAFAANYYGGVSVSVADMNGDGYADIMTGALGGPQVRVFSGFNYSMLLDFTTVSGGLSTQVAFRSFVEDGPVRLVTMTTTSSSHMLTSYDTSLSKQFSTTYSSASNANPPRRIG